MRLSELQPKYKHFITEGKYYSNSPINEERLYETFLDSAKQYLGARFNQTLDDVGSQIQDVKNAAIVIKDVVSNEQYLNDTNIQLFKRCQMYAKQLDRLATTNDMVKSIWQKIKPMASDLIANKGWKGFLSRLGVSGFLKFILVNSTKLQSNLVEMVIEKLADLEDLLVNATMGAFIQIFEGAQLIKKYFLDTLSEIKKKLDFKLRTEETYHGNEFYEAYGHIPDMLIEAEYQGRKVTLNKPVRSTDGPKKFHVYVKNDKGNIVKVNFGDKNMKIKKNIPARRKSFRARHNCDDPGPKWKARYWSCRAW